MEREFAFTEDQMPSWALFGTTDNQNETAVRTKPNTFGGTALTKRIRRNLPGGNIAKVYVKNKPFLVSIIVHCQKRFTVRTKFWRDFRKEGRAKSFSSVAFAQGHLPR